jgi:hypothetical protein
MRTGGRMNYFKLFFLLAGLVVPFSQAENVSDSQFVCKILYPAQGNTSVRASELQAALIQDCDLTKPFSSSVVDGSESYAAQMLYCCTLK